MLLPVNPALFLDQSFGLSDQMLTKVDVTSMAQRKKIIASYYGDWLDAYRKKDVGLVKHYLLVGFSICVDHILKTIARHSEVLFCVGRSLAYIYGDLAKLCR